MRHASGLVDFVTIHRLHSLTSLMDPSPMDLEVANDEAGRRAIILFVKQRGA